MTLPYARSAVALAALAVLFAAPPALAQAVPDITVSPAAADLGALSVPGGFDFEVEVRNDGVGDLVVTDAFATDITGDGAFGGLYGIDGFVTDFDLDLPYTLAPGETQAFGLTISPRVGRQNGSVTFVSNDPDEPTAVVPVTFLGTQIRFGPVMPAQIDFGTVSVAADALGNVTEAPTVCREVRVPTEGDEPGQAFGSLVDDDQFSVPADTDPIGDDPFALVTAGDTLRFDVCYTPDTVGPASAELEFSAGSTLNADAVLRTVALVGEATTTNLPPVPQGIADGDVFDIPYDPATRLIAGTVAFSFISPEAGQTTTVSSPSFDRFGDFIDESDDVDADVVLTTAAGNPATGEIEVFLAPGILATGGDTFDVTLDACDDGPNGGECSTVTVTFRLDFFPTRGCVVAESWDVIGFDADASSGAESVTVYAGGPGPLDLGDCTFVAFDPFTERVTLAVDLRDAAVLAPFEDADPFLTFGPDEIPDGPGAIAFVQGDAAVGDPVSSVSGRLAYALVYFDDETPFGVFPAGNQPPFGARRSAPASGAGDLAALLAGVRGSAEAGARPLAVGPNPARGGAAATFALEAEAEVRVAVYDVLGREVAVLAEGPYPAGAHRVALDAGALPAGAYVVRLVAGGAVQAARLTVVR